MAYTLSSKAYLKIVFHAAKYPHQPVNGVLVGSDKAGVEILDVIPLLHHWTSLSPMMEIGLDLAVIHAESEGLKLVGYYQACERLDDTALAPVGEKIATRIKQTCPNAVAFVINGQTIGTGDVALIPYTSAQASSSSWQPQTSAQPPFSPGSSFQLVSPDIATRAVSLIRDKKLYEKFGDFDDHLEQVTIDWLRNKECIPAGI